MMPSSASPVSNGVPVSSLDGAAVNRSRKVRQKSASQLLSRDEPVGVTAIVGGTNVRFCISHPGSQEPLTYAVKWQKLHKLLTPKLQKAGIEFCDAKHLVMALLAKNFVDFFAEQYPSTPTSPPFERIAAFNFSVAGVVRGEGSEAKVSTTNTGVRFADEAIGVELLKAIQDRISEKGWAPIPTNKVAVLNDAVAGMLGERLYGGLQRVQHGLFVILGTGVGSMGLTDGKLNYDYNELGHRIIFNTNTNQARMIEGASLNDYLEPDGSFKNPGVSQCYAENKLAGPWLAIRFVKGQEEKATMDALAVRIVQSLNSDEEAVLVGLDQVLVGLDKLANLLSKDRPRWAVTSDGALVRAVNKVILNPNMHDLFKALPPNFNVMDQVDSNPEKALTCLAFTAWKEYFMNVGRFLRTASISMGRKGHCPERIVLGGGLGEACHEYPPFLRQEALSLIHEFAELQEGTVDFSSVSPELRESALTHQAVIDAYNEQRAQVASSLSN